MLTKIAVHTEAGTPISRQDADSALRETVRRLASNWTLQDPNPGGYTSLLDRLSSGGPGAAVPDADRGLLQRPHDVARALADLIADGLIANGRVANGARVELADRGGGR